MAYKKQDPKNKIEDPRLMNDIGRQYLEQQAKIDDYKMTVAELVNMKYENFIAQLDIQFESERKRIVEHFVDKKYSGKNKYARVFYVEVMLKRERLMSGSEHPHYIGRKSCPTPRPEQIVYKNNERDERELLWSLPSFDECKFYFHNRHDLRMQSRPILKDVMDYFGGKLHTISDEADKENIGIEPTEFLDKRYI